MHFLVVPLSEAARGISKAIDAAGKRILPAGPQMTAEVLEARLQVLEQEILRLTQLAAQEKETEQQDRFWQLAQDLQRDAREIRSEMRKMIESECSPKSSPSAAVKKLLATETQNLFALPRYN